jgi:hypothetical protein
MFIDDLYNDQRAIKDGVFPGELLTASANFREQCRGVRPKHGVWAHISGTDLVRDEDGVMYVLEDNLRVPSGVSYVIENRAVAKRAFAELFARQQLRPVDGYTDELKRLLISLAPDGVVDWTQCVERAGPRRESIEVHGSHFGIGFNPAAIYVIGDRLAQPAGEWQPFRPGSAARGLFPRPSRPVTAA